MSDSPTDIWIVDIESWGSVVPCSSKALALSFLAEDLSVPFGYTLISKREYNNGDMVELTYDTTPIRKTFRISVKIYRATLDPHVHKEPTR
jgi:hypothetical protein